MKSNETHRPGKGVKAKKPASEDQSKARRLDALRAFKESQLPTDPMSLSLITSEWVVLSKQVEDARNQFRGALSKLLEIRGLERLFIWREIKQSQGMKLPYMPGNVIRLMADQVAMRQFETLAEISTRYFDKTFEKFLFPEPDTARLWSEFEKSYKVHESRTQPISDKKRKKH